MTSENSRRSEKKEDRKGILVLGTLATLLAAREYYVNEQITFGAIPVPIVFFANIILVLWGLYTFTAALALTEEWLPDSLCDILYSTSQAFFGIGSIFTIFLFIVFSILGYQGKILILLLPLFPFIIYFLLRNIKKINMKFNFNYSGINKKRLLVQIFAIGFVVIYQILLMNVFKISYFKKFNSMLILVLSLGLSSIIGYLLLLNYHKKTELIND